MSHFRSSRRSLPALLGLVLAGSVGVCGQVGNAQSITLNPLTQGNITGIESIAAGVGGITQMTFGPDGRLYVATFGSGILRYDYDPHGSLTNKTTVWSRPANPPAGVINGSLGVAFHEDANLGVVMYLAPAVSGNFDVSRNFAQSIVRLTDSDGDGNWGELADGEVNQTIVDNLRVTDLHQVNQMVVKNDSLYVGIGSRTRTGGQINGEPHSELPGDPNPDDGEFAYTGAINWIRDLTLLSGDTTTTNLAGHNITSHHTDTTPFTSTNEGKLTIYSTGFRNVYGLALDTEGQLWATMNQNENPLKPDELHRSDFQDDHGFPKANEVSGNWKTNADAIASGFFQTFKDPVSELGNNASANGITFTGANSNLDEYAFIVRYSAGKDLIAVHRETGEIIQVASGFASPLDVTTDPYGDLLVGDYGGGGQIFRIDVFGNMDADLNQDGLIDAVDWGIIRANFNADLTGLTPPQAKALGDLTSDFVIDRVDLALFKRSYEDFNGAGTFAQLGAPIPEPQTLLIMLPLLLGAATVSRQWRLVTRSET